MSNLSILMAVYNGLPYLPEAIDSIRKQTLQDWVFIIVNDGSTDGTVEYLDQLNDSRIQVIHTSNHGLGAALNRGLKLCQTEFVARMDSDDLAHPTRLEEQLDFLRQHPEIGLLGTQIEEMGSIRIRQPASLPTDHDTLYANLLNGRAAIWHPTIMCRTAILKEIGGYWTARLGEEWDLFLRVGERSRLANLDRVLLSYRIHTGSMCGSQLFNMRAHVGFACECARRRQSGAPAIDYEDFLALRRAAPLWRRAIERSELYARRQYRIALGEILGTRQIHGRLRLAWAAICSPLLTCQRIVRVLRHGLAVS